MADERRGGGFGIPRSLKGGPDKYYYDITKILHSCPSPPPMTDSLVLWYTPTLATPPSITKYRGYNIEN